MAPNSDAAEIAALGRLCGIAPEYWDNSGARQVTSAACFEALLSAMGVPWQDPDRRRQELVRRRLGPWRRFLQPVQVLPPAPPSRIYCYLITPSAELPASLKVRARLASEVGPELDWQDEFSPPPGTAVKAGPEGFRHRLELQLPWKLPLGYFDLELGLEAGDWAEAGRTRLIVAPEQVYLPEALAGGQRRWGFNLPLYALQSARNWGIGDFGDLTPATDWAASLGAAFVGVNPLHAPLPSPAADPSPYSPSSRLFNNFLYLDLEAVPELDLSPEARTLVSGREFQAVRATLREGPLVPYEQLFHLKRRVLVLLFQAFEAHHGSPEAPRTPRGAEFAEFLQQGGVALKSFGEFGALADHWQQGDWRRWPPEYHHPGNPAVADFVRTRPQEVRLHQYGQWLAAAQLREVGETARRRGLPFTLYRDLALGSNPGGFDTWAYPDLFARKAAIGAPPDAFNPRGQNWGLPPIIPEALRESGYQLFIDTLRANAPEGGMLRLDHVMGLFRLLWIPAGMEPAAGTYVHYPARELLAVLALESVRRRALIVGEDLGTVSPRVRRDLSRGGIFSYRVFYFERESGGGFLAPDYYPARAVATVTTHDLPTLAGFWEGRDLAFKKGAGLYPAEDLAEADAAQRQQDRRRLVEALQNRGLLPAVFKLPAGDAGPCPPQVRTGVLQYLAQSPAALMEVRLEEVFGFTEPQNFPGTRREHPNWRLRLPLTLEEMVQDREPVRLATQLNKYRSPES